MKARRIPRVALALLRHFVGGRFKESLEGDLQEEFEGGRSTFWYWREVGCALYERACFVVRQQTTTFIFATLFFLTALWAIAPVTYPVMGWAHNSEPLRIALLLGWLAGVPMVLGAVAGAIERRSRIGAILLGAGFAYFTPVTLPFSLAACDLCRSPVDVTLPNSVLILTPFGSALLAGTGAWLIRKFHPTPNPEESP